MLARMLNWIGVPKVLGWLGVPQEYQRAFTIFNAGRKAAVIIMAILASGWIGGT
jgi:hypothetical protein